MMSTITLIAMMVIGIAIIILSYKCVKLLSLNKKLTSDIATAEYFLYKLRIQLKHSIPQCGGCGRLVSKKDRAIRHGIPYCPKCYAGFHTIDKGKTYDN